MDFIENNRNGLVYMTSPNIGTMHAFTTRYGGVSKGIYESLNLGRNVGDNDEDLRENYNILSREIGTNKFVFSRQVHGRDVQRVSSADCLDIKDTVPYNADSLVTDETDIALFVFNADCVPILLHDPVKSVIGAVHAGWRGTSDDICGATIEKMQTEFGCDPADVRAAIGPCIDKCCFETDEDVAIAMRDQLGHDAEEFLTPCGKKYMVDLKGLNYTLLKRAGVKDTIVSDECTKCSCDKYWSHRATNGKRGSQAAVIMLRG